MFDHLGDVFNHVISHSWHRVWMWNGTLFNLSIIMFLLLANVGERVIFHLEINTS